MSVYPILVEKWDEQHPADACVCERCHQTFTWNPEDGDPYDLCSKHGNAALGECGGDLVMKYDWAPKCGGCGKLGHHSERLNLCCSRKCMLQAEYAESLKARAS